MKNVLKKKKTTIRDLKDNLLKNYNKYLKLKAIKKCICDNYYTVFASNEETSSYITIGEFLNNLSYLENTTWEVDEIITFKDNDKLEITLSTETKDCNPALILKQELDNFNITFSFELLADSEE